MVRLRKSVEVAETTVDVISKTRRLLKKLSALEDKESGAAKTKEQRPPVMVVIENMWKVAEEKSYLSQT